MTPRSQKLMPGKKFFSQDEDKRLLVLVDRYGENWACISKYMKDRTARQCRERYKYFLSPSINREEWNSEEDQLILREYMEYGPKWANIAKHLSNRTGVSVKNRFRKLIKKQNNPDLRPKTTSDEDSEDWLYNKDAMLEHHRMILHLPSPIALIPISI